MAVQFLAPVAMSIGGAIAAGFTSLIGFLATMATGRVLIVTAAVAAITALTVGFIAFINTMAGSMSQALPAEVLAFAQAVMPRNMATCLSVILTANIAKWIYQKNIEVVKMLAK